MPDSSLIFLQGIEKWLVVFPQIDTSGASRKSSSMNIESVTSDSVYPNRIGKNLDASYSPSRATSRKICFGQVNVNVQKILICKALKSGNAADEDLLDNLRSVFYSTGPMTIPSAVHRSIKRLRERRKRLKSFFSVPVHPVSA